MPKLSNEIWIHCDECHERARPLAGMTKDDINKDVICDECEKKKSESSDPVEPDFDLQSARE